MDNIALLLLEIKQQHRWRMEDTECGGGEVDDSWILTKLRIQRELDKSGDIYDAIIAELDKS
jgi:hypothetical protein